MLVKPLQPTRLASISLALVGLMWVLPFLHYRHEYPLTSFYQEWWSALLGLLSIALLTARESWRQLEIPRIVQFPAALAGIVLLQSSMGRVAYFDQALLCILYLLFAALLILLGARLRACFGIEKLSVVLAYCLLIGAELSAIAGAVQHFHWHTPLDAVIVMLTSEVIYGNLAQSNHFADYIALGLISSGLLFQLRKLNPIQMILLSVPLLFAMTLSGSRSSWLYLVLMVALAWWPARRDVALRPLLRYSLLLMAGFILMNLAIQLSFMAGADSGTTSAERLLAYSGVGDTGNSTRLYLWHEAWLMLMQFPMLGAGFGQFSWHHFQLMPLLHAGYISGLYNNAHNLVFQLAAETGIAGLLVLFMSMGVWLHGLRRVRPTASHWWGYAALGVLAIHSLLEYPLWYAYFLAVAAVLLGVFDETRYHLKLHSAGRFFLALILLLGLLLLVQLHGSYQRLKDALAIPLNTDNAISRMHDGLLAARRDGSLLSPYAELYTFAYTDVDEDQIKQKLVLGSSVIRFIPVAAAVYRQAFLLAQDGQLDLSRQRLEQAIWSYPDNGDARQLLQNLSAKDPAHFSALLEFYFRKEQERARAVRNQ